MPTLVMAALALTVTAQGGALAPPPGDTFAPRADQPLDGVGATGALDPRYAGVAPGPGARNPLPAPARKPPRLVWTGFRMNGDRSQVFLQTTGPVTFDLQQTTGGKQVGKQAAADGGGSGTGLSVFLRNCRIHLRNNGRRLDTRFFATPVAAVSARQRRKDIELSIALKHSIVPEVRTEPGPDGTQFLVLEFPSAAAETTAAR